MGFLSCLGFRRHNTRHTRRPATPTTPSEQAPTPAQSPPATPWTAYRDAYGRSCWYNKTTKQWTYSTPHGNAGIFVAVPPQQFWPVSPYPGRFHHPAPWAGVVPASPVVVFPAPPVPEEKKEEKNDKKGYWKEIYSERDPGEKHWEHTGTRKITHRDPYV